MSEREPLKDYSPYQMDRLGCFTYALEICHWLSDLVKKRDHEGGDRIVMYQDLEGNNVTLDLDHAWHGASDIVEDMERSLIEEGMGQEVHDVIELAKKEWAKK